jgi:hypothetical protein
MKLLLLYLWTNLVWAYVEDDLFYNREHATIRHRRVRWQEQHPQIRNRQMGFSPSSGRLFVLGGFDWKG